MTTHGSAPVPWLPLQRPLFAISLDPYTLHEVGRGDLPAGTLVEDGASLVHRAEVQRVVTLTTRVRASADARRIEIAKVNVGALRDALGL